LGVLLLAAVSGSPGGRAAGAGLTNLTVGIAGAGDALTAPELGLALVQGEFQKQGLNVNVISLQPQASLLTAALMTNQVQIIWSGIGPYFLARSKGVALSYFYMDEKFGSSGALFGGSKAQNLDMLKGLTGLRCGSGSPGTTSYATTQFYEKVFGFQCGSYVTVTGESTALGSLKAGSLDVVVNQVSWAQDAVKNGDGYMLANPADPATYAKVFGGQPIIYTGFVAMKTWLDANDATVKAFVSAISTGEAYFQSQSQDQVVQQLSKIPNLAETGPEIQTLVVTTRPFALFSRGAVSRPTWDAALKFYSNFFSMDFSTPTYAYGEFWVPTFTTK